MSLPFYKYLHPQKCRLHKLSKNLRLRLCALLCGGMLLLVPCGCAKTPNESGVNPTSPSTELSPAPSPQNLSAEETFSALLDDFFREYVTSDSLSLHYTVAYPEKLNLTLPSVSLGHFSLDALSASSDTANKYLDRLHRFSRETLSENEQLSYDLIAYALECSVLPENTLLYDSPLGPTTGLQTQLPVLLAEYRFSSLQDVEDYFLLLEDMPRYFSELCAFEEARSAAGTQACAEVLSRILLQCNSFVEDPGKNFLIESFRDRLAVLPELTAEQTAELCIRNQKLVFTKVIPAYEQLIETLKCLTDTSVPTTGLAAFPDGAECYSALVKRNTGSDKSIPELEQMLQKELTESMLTLFTLYESEDLQKELKTYQKEGLAPKPTSEATSADGSSDEDTARSASVNETKAASATDFSSSLLQKLQLQITADFPTPADASFRVEAVHPSLEDFISPAFYLIPSFDNYKENVIYINREKCSTESLFSTLAHEGYPGHLYQNTYFAATSPHPVRMLLNFTGYDEGWGTYAELYAYQYADCSEELRQFLIAEQVAGLCLYSLSDIRIHYYGDDLTAVSALLQKYGFSPESAEELFYTQLAEPGIYLPYSVGYLELCELRALYLEQKGADASLLPFHTFLLETGPAPFSILKELLLYNFS